MVFHCLQTSLTFHNEISSKCENIVNKTSTGNESILPSIRSTAWAWDNKSTYWLTFLGASGLGTAKNNSSGSSGVLSFSSTIAKSSLSILSRSAKLYGGSSFPESSSSDNLVIACSGSFNGKRNEWHVPQIGSPKFGP